MPDDLDADVEKILATLVSIFAEVGHAREVALIALSRHSVVHTQIGDLFSGRSRRTIHLEVPVHLYSQIESDREKLEKILLRRVQELTREARRKIDNLVIMPQMTDDPAWREKAKAWVTGQGVTNQGRARSDNLAPRMADGLLFRSEQEINLYRALKALGVSFAPLPVFVRGGQTYRRIEPDFLVIKDGVSIVVEVDGDTVHRESPREAHERLTMLTLEGVHVERVNANECETPDLAKGCAAKVLRVIEKLKANK